MKALRENFNGIIICLFELVIGILLLINPVGFTSGIIVAAGGILCLSGLVNCIKYFRAEIKEASKGQFLTKGLVALIAGAFCIFNTDWFIVTFSALTVIYGVVVLLASVEKIQLCVDMLRQKRKKWYLAAISAVISLVCAAIILKNPFSSTAVIWIVAGVSLILEAVFDVYTLMANLGKQEKNINVSDLEHGSDKVINITKTECEEGNSEDINSDKVNSEDVKSEEANSEGIKSEEAGSEDVDGKKNKLWGRGKK